MTPPFIATIYILAKNFTIVNSFLWGATKAIAARLRGSNEYGNILRRACMLKVYTKTSDLKY